MGMLDRLQKQIDKEIKGGIYRNPRPPKAPTNRGGSKYKGTAHRRTKGKK